MTYARQELLVRLDRYFDAVPRSVTRTEEIGPFTLFINQGDGWRYYARPRPGESSFAADEVRMVVDRQRELDQPRQFEWVADLAPGVGAATADAGLTIEDRPLMAMRATDFEPTPPPPGAQVRLLDPDEDLATATAVAMIGFGAPGTSIGAASVDQLPEVAAALDPRTIEFARTRMAAGMTRLAVATIDGVPVASGSHQPADGVTEVTGVACLPAFRRRGLGAAVTSALVADALGAGVATVCLSAGDDEISRVYARVGFRQVGRVGEAVMTPEPAPDD
ncbi:MAG TPA: GNAT family N-acetyltransferase [Actinomycetota bacterium]